MSPLQVSNVMVGAVRTQSTPSIDAARPSVPVQRQTTTEDGKAQPQDVQPVVMNDKKLNDEVERLNENVQQERRDLQFSVDEKSGRTIIKIVDSQTKEVIREIPPEEVRVLAERLEKGQGLLTPTKA